MSPFEKELTLLINRYSKENESNTPDFILARFMASSLDSFVVAIRSRNDWFNTPIGSEPKAVSLNES